MFDLNQPQAIFLAFWVGLVWVLMAVNRSNRRYAERRDAKLNRRGR